MPTLEFSGAFSSPPAGLALDTDENLLTIENGSGSGRTLSVWAAWSVHDQSQQYCLPAHVLKATAMPSGGNTAAKGQVGGGGSSASQVVVRTSRTTDNGAITGITTSSEQTAWRVWPPRLAGGLLAVAMGSMWGSPMDSFIELKEGEALVLRNSFAASPNDGTNTNRRISGMIYWEEYTPDAAAATARMLATLGAGA